MEKTVKHAARLAVYLGATLSVWLIFKFALPALTPIAIALLVSSAVRPVARLISRKSHTPVKFCGGVLVFLLVFAAVYASVILSIKLFGEASEFLASAVRTLESEDNVIRRVADYFKSLWDKVPLISGKGNAKIPDEIYSLLLDGVKAAATKVSEGAASLAAGFLGSLPDLLFSLVVSVIAMLYLTVDIDGVKDGILSLFPVASSKKVIKFGRIFGGAVSGYIKAYFILGLLTFAGLFLGFVLLRVKYSFFLALVISIIDILPVLGAGTVLIPWAAFLFIMGDVSKGVGLLVLCGIMYAVRQFIEPRLIGRFMGLHPLITLTSAYVGYRLFGLAGMLTAPLALYVLRIAKDSSPS